MIPSIGRIVHYKLSKFDAEQINLRRKHAQERMDWHRALKSGAQVHVGNTVEEGDVFPMMIVRVWGSTPESCVNGQVFLDGSDTFWATSVSVGFVPGSYAWPARV
jgi:hypothetical protein